MSVFAVTFLTNKRTHMHL